ncbi:hypothetical protein RHMOL_Rhmol05G0165800 [Rhododendron molle]|uniref:Uncharacterized protein n=1 Tax=Rhododendron molle TaxID=49168 RepID=A0ACC0NS66_RHOML|nr:hypothetical protein RHMOL_Rhmol05G0165800 [Rhododendron molle]
MACFYYKKEGHMIRDCPKLVGQTCYHCKEDGYMIRDCPMMKGQSKEAAVVQDTELLLVEEKPNVARQTNWALDTGCSFHVCGDRERVL